MKKNYLFKLFAIVFVFIMFAIPSWAAPKTLNNLSKIMVEQADVNTYKLNLIFNDKYKGNAFIQKKGKGEYYIFLPDSTANIKKTKVQYDQKKDKSNIGISIEEKPYITSNNNSRYLRLTVTTQDDYTLQVGSSTIAETKNGFATFFFGLLKTAAAILFIALAIFFVAHYIKINKKLKYDPLKNGYSASKKRIRKREDKPVTIPSTSIKRTLKNVADDSSFTCFDISSEGTNKTNYYNFKRTLKDNSSLSSNSKIKTNKKQTNPIKESTSELSIPIVEDAVQTKKTQEKKSEAELISVLNITPRIGFYLTNVGETLALFGFVGENVYLFKKFSDLSQINLQARFYDKHGDNDLYIVKLDNYKAMIEISKTGMKELAVL